MGEEIVMYIPGSCYYWISLGIGIFSLILLAIAAASNEDCNDKEKTSKKTLIIWLIITVMLFIASPIVKHNYDNPRFQANYEAGVNKLQTIQEAYQEHFYLKEQTCDSEISGEISGGFLFFGGSIFGRIDTAKIVTILYGDNDPVIDHYVGVNRSASFHLDEVLIKTIPAGEHSYLMYPEAKILEAGREIRLVPGAPHFYLPEGWEIL